MTTGNTRARPDLLGVLGGMGPLATADFLTKLIALTPARVDIDHIPVVVSSEPQIPVRVLGMKNEDPDSPLPALLERRDMLVRSGVRAIAMPCNTAHYWYGDLTRDLEIPFLHIVDSVIGVLEKSHPGMTVGLMATKATIEGRLYENPIRDRGFGCLVAEEDLMATHVVKGIALVKEHRLPEARALLREAVERLLDRGAEKVVLGCTELPVGLDMSDPWVEAHCIDPTAALARECVEWALRARAG